MRRLRNCVRVPLVVAQSLSGAPSPSAQGGNGCVEWQHGFIGLALATLWVAVPVGAVCVGDCNANGTVAISEVQRCANIFLGTQTVANCPNCDRNGNGTVTIAEVQAASNAFLNIATCLQVTPGAGGATPTPPAPAATSTPTPTDTQGAGALC